MSNNRLRGISPGTTLMHSWFSDLPHFRHPRAVQEVATALRMVLKKPEMNIGFQRCAKRKPGVIPEGMPLMSGFSRTVPVLARHPAIPVVPEFLLPDRDAFFYLLDDVA